MAAPSQVPDKLIGLPAALILVGAFAVTAPFLIFGNPSGHDLEFHMNSWMEVLSQWKQGVIYPAWAGMAHYGFGEPRFIFYPPVSWTLGAILGGLLPWVAVPGAYVVIALVLSGCSMFLLARSWLGRGDAILAALFYTTNPYYIVEIYWRSAFAELLAGALLPLAFLAVWRLNETPTHRNVLKLALVIAAAWLTNIPAAVMVTYSIALLAIVLAVRGRPLAIILRGGIAGALGLALGAAYLLPAIYEQKWISVSQLFAPGVQPADNFLFTLIPDSDHNRFNLLISLVAFAEIVALGGAVFVLLSRKRAFRRSEFPPLALWGLWCSGLMLSFAELAWKYLPKLQFVQLPWRWLLCLNVPLTVLATVAWRRWQARAVLFVAIFSIVWFVGYRVQPPWWDNTADIAEMQANQQNGVGYEGADEYVPAGIDPDNVNKAPLVAAEENVPVQVHVQRWNAQEKVFATNSSIPAKLDLRLFNYPLWRVEINGKTVNAETKDETGQMVIHVESGLSNVRIHFVTGWDREFGMVLSVVTLILVMLLNLRNWKKSPYPVIAPLSSPGRDDRF